MIRKMMNAAVALVAVSCMLFGQIGLAATPTQTIGGNQTSVFTPTNAASAISYTAAGTYTMPTNGASWTSFRITGTYTGLAGTFQVSNDNVNWTTVPAYPVAAGVPVFAVVASTANYFVNVQNVAYSYVRFNITAVSTGSAKVQAASVVNSVSPLFVGDAYAHYFSAASTNATSVVAGAHLIRRIYGINTNAAPQYIKLYDTATAPTCGSGTPILVITAPTNVTVDVGGIDGLPVVAGIGFCITGAAADADSSAATTGGTWNVLYQ